MAIQTSDAARGIYQLIDEDNVYQERSMIRNKARNTNYTKSFYSTRKKNKLQPSPFIERAIDFIVRTSQTLTKHMDSLWSLSQKSDIKIKKVKDCKLKSNTALRTGKIGALPKCEFHFN